MIDVQKHRISLPGKPVTPEVFRQIKDVLQPLYPKGFTVRKSQGLGPMRGEVVGKIGDLIVFCGAGICCFRKESLEKLNRSGIHPTQAFPVLFKSGSDWEDEIVEGAVHGLVSFGNAVHPKRDWNECQHCGGYSLRRLDESKICIKKSSIPKEGDFFTVKQWGTIHIVTERFRSASENILTNASFTEVPIVDE